MNRHFGIPRLYVRPGIVDGDLDFEVAEASPGETLGDVRRLGLRMALGSIRPRQSIEAEGVHDQRIAFPAPDGITQPGRLRVCRQWTAVEKHLAKSGIGGRLIKQNYQPGRLDDLEWMRRVRSRHVDAGHPWRHAPGERIVLVQLA